MRAELPINEKAYNDLIKFNLDTVLFRVEGIPNTAFLIAHGTEDGMISLRGGHICTPKEVLERMMYVIKDKGITEVKTISCHGGLQQEAIVDGIKISSIHNHPGTIQCKAAALIDDTYILEIYVDSDK